MFAKIRAAGMVSASVALIFGSALAHHSFADFDRTKTKTVTGTVRTLEWENPHIWLWVNVTDAKGNVVPWGFEGSAPAESTRQGFDRHKLNKGDMITVTFSPLRDGRNGGSFSRIVKADGTVVGGGPGPGAGGPGGKPGGPGGPPGGPGGPPGGPPPG